MILRSAAVAGGLVLALAGCGVLMPGGGQSVDRTSAGPGVTEDSVKVVFVGVDLDAVKEQTGFKTASVGDPEKQVQVLEDWVNDNGGLGGRKLDAVFKMYDAQTDSPASEEKLCNEVSQDEQAFAVVLLGQYQSNARPCYAQRKTLMLDISLVASDKTIYEELAPYLWTPSFPEHDAFVNSYIAALDEQGFFEGRDEVAIIAADSPVNRRSVENKAVPLLEERGIKGEVAWVDTTDIGTIYTGGEQAAVTLAGKGIDRVIFLGGSRLASIFATIAGSKQFTPRYAISSFDNPSFFLGNPETVPSTTMDGMVGIGFHPPQDVADDQMPFPAEEGPEAECVAVFEAAGITFESREGARQALPYCDAARLLKLGGDNVDGELNAATWADAVKKHGAEFQTASGFGNALDKGNAAAGAYRVLKFADDCRCFVYEGDEVPFADE
ncbi:ABC transporter substrate-binding protein [Nocardioides sp. zg-ZUI104]|uniref:ABC transporter substrate-binding protein n=1 Tax=Nocardioides faecalis TaxID=2803858 RepID=UPI001BCBC606|nr:ABC transporter substrate-binding protein [Nocardioides faecalis]MBS4751424.1 ABC transporter substrate-binding protein [Nocardioides faecalis]